MTARSRPALRFAALVGAMVCAALAARHRPGHAGQPKPPVWEVYAIRYATVPAFPVHHLVAGADTTRKTDIAMMFWLLQGPEHRHVLVDAGFYRQKFLDAWKPAGYIMPSAALQRMGIDPDSITDIIVTHVHWDHLDGADLFPNARVWIQRAEYEYYVGPGGVPLHPAIDTLDAQMLVRLDLARRLVQLDADGRQIMPGITIYTGGKHTYASQYVGVRIAKGTVVVASDNVYLYENLDRHVPIAQTLDSTANLAAQDRMRQIASSLKLIVPGHDPAVFKRFRGDFPGVVRIR
jgi:glyoxylase-like metal-dependent hydrolase (beta-lactamase superfamily II)